MDSKDVRCLKYLTALFLGVLGGQALVVSTFYGAFILTLGVLICILLMESDEYPPYAN